jgi:acyl-CoA synthetase (AMP-forming)/AMP-acid ligase II
MPKFDLVRFLEIVQEYSICRAYIVPPIILALTKYVDLHRYNMSSLKCLISGAAPLDGALQQLCSERLKCTVKQAWGMTECSPVGTFSPGHTVKTGSAGQLVCGTEGKIIDVETGVDLQCFQEGEVCIRGPQVMPGYLNNPTATENTLDNQNWLHTGDIGRFDEEGWVYITDRKKELIKYKGFQVAPAELEGILLTMPGILDAVVIPVVDEEAGELPRAYVVTKDGPCGDKVITHQDVVKYIAERVAPHKQLRGGVCFTNGKYMLVYI